MHKNFALALGVAAVGAAIAVARVRRGPETPELIMGTFPNGMGYARLGTGPKSLLWIPDPGHTGHRGTYLKLMTRMLRPFVGDGYTVFLVGQKPNLPNGCTVADMAEDYAGLIVDEFGGKVDVVVGDSSGGLIGFCLAARHPDLFGHVSIIAAGHTMTLAARAANLESAHLRSAGRKTDAATVMVNFLYPDIRAPWVKRLLAAVVARVSFPAAFDPSDVLIAAEAVDAFDGRAILPTIPVPVLMVFGDRDRFVAKELYEQTADLIPDCTVKRYEGKDHLGTMFDKRLPRDVLEFVRRPRALQH